ncbi:MAG: AbrB/MazE/SpoVT family DNA-binding domain-containing protein [Coriobacteriales bacterium]|nr:AbrB/MazE/SpoVT family DNA-binding domain-containing protein [Coriobacteriales bacterium]
MYAATLTSKGQIVVPAGLRAKAGLKAGDRLEFEYDKGTKALVMRRAETIDEVSKRLSGYLRPGTTPLGDAAEFYARRKARA